MGRGLHLLRWRGAHHGIVEFGRRTYDAFGGQLLETVDREDDVEVLLEAGAVVFQRDVTHDDVAGRRGAGDHPGVARIGGKGPVAPALQPGRRDDGDAALVQRRTADPGFGIEGDALEIFEEWPHPLVYIFHTDHDTPTKTSETGGSRPTRRLPER